jgi:hypothetical protein
MKDFSLDLFKEKFEREAVRLIRDSKVPGMSVLITKDNEVLYQRALGSREWQGGKPATLDKL